MKRIVEIDLLRGLALLGIFLMNIIAMAYPLEAYTNPFAFDVDHWHLPTGERVPFGWTVNEVIFSVLHVFVDQKMMGLFSLLFGISTMLFLEKLREQQQSLKFYFIRNGWLILFGFLHGIFVFIGDILLIYAICSMILWVFARMKAHWQLVFGILVFYVPVVMLLLMQSSINSFTPEQLLQLEGIWMPSSEHILQQIEWAQLPLYSDFLLNNLGFLQDAGELSSVGTWYGSALFFEGFARAFGMMLVGMGLYQLGFLSQATQEKESKRIKAGLIGLFVGVMLACCGLWLNYSHDWQAAYSAIQGRVLNNIATPLMVFAYAMLCLVWAKSARSAFSRKLQNALQAVGRMALSNYITQSVVGLILFTGMGFTLYGQLNRFELLLIVILVWALQLMVSVWWMNRFYLGPLEWLWRCLTYFKWVRLCRVTSL